MGSKLRMKQRPTKTKLPMSNKQFEELKTAAFATRKQLEEAEARMKQEIYKDVNRQLEEEIIPKIREEIEQDAWNESEEWTNVINTCSGLLALNRLEGYSAKRMMRYIKTANSFVEKVNNGEMTVMDMIDELESKHKIMFDDQYKELVKRYQP